MNKVWIVTFEDDLNEQTYIITVCNTRTLAMQVVHNEINDECPNAAYNVVERPDGALRINYRDGAHYEIESWNVQTEV